MTLDDFILTTFCVVDDHLRAPQLSNVRGRGPQPVLADSEVLTIALVGEFLGCDQDTKIVGYCRQHGACAFPGLWRVHRTTLVRQAANLWAVKQRWQQHLAGWLTARDPLWHVDSMPAHACPFARAPSCRRCCGAAWFGKDPVIRQTCYGFRLHRRTSSAGIIPAAVLAPANAPETERVWELEPPPGRVGIGDRGYGCPALMEQWAEGGIQLLAPDKRKGYDPKPEQSKKLRRRHWLIETVNSPLAARLQAKRTWAQDLWPWCSRIVRKVLSHTVAAWVNLAEGRRPLDFASILTD